MPEVITKYTLTDGFIYEANVERKFRVTCLLEKKQTVIAAPLNLKNALLLYCYFLSDTCVSMKDTSHMNLFILSRHIEFLFPAVVGRKIGYVQPHG